MAASDAPAFHMRRRIEPDDAQVQEISAQWSKALRGAFDSLPEALAGE